MVQDCSGPKEGKSRAGQPKFRRPWGEKRNEVVGELRFATAPQTLQLEDADKSTRLPVNGDSKNDTEKYRKSKKQSEVAVD